METERMYTAESIQAALSNLVSAVDAMAYTDIEDFKTEVKFAIFVVTMNLAYGGTVPIKID